jgi:hypothetical protein
VRDRRAPISKRLLSICLTYPQPLTVGRGRGRPAGSVRVNTLTRRELLAFNGILGKLRVGVGMGMGVGVGGGACAGAGASAIVLVETVRKD